jgi:hypothetical protein
VIYEDIARHIKQVSSEEVQQGFSPTLAFYQQIQEDGEIYRLLSTSRAGHLLMKRLIELVAERIQVQLEARFSTEQLLAPMEIIAFHVASAQIGLANWWLENDQPYPAEYMAQISFWLSMAGNARGFGLEEFPIGPPEIPEKMG